jgi:hypothetical protein
MTKQSQGGELTPLTTGHLKMASPFVNNGQGRGNFGNHIGTRFL